MKHVGIAHFADCHFMGHRSNLRAQIDVLKSGIAECGPSTDLFVFAGDLAGHDAPHRLRIDERLGWVEVLRYAATWGVVLVVGGNHDYFPELDVFKKLRSKNQIIIANGGIETVKIDRIGTVICAPWLSRSEILPTAGKLPAGMENIEAAGILSDRILRQRTVAPKPEPVLLVAHYPVLGASFGTFEITTPTDVNLDPVLFRGFDYVALGHIHRRQQVADNAWYPANPYPLDHSDTEAKGYLFITLTPDRQGQWKRDVEFRPLSSWQMKTIETTWDNGKFATDWGHENVKNCHVRLQINRVGVIGGWNREEITEGFLLRGALSLLIEPVKQNQSQLPTLTEKVDPRTIEQDVEDVLRQKGLLPSVQSRILGRLSELKREILTQ